jgi:teichoic acid transport system ATP-binding protein
LKINPINQYTTQKSKGKALVQAQNIGVKYIIGSKREDFKSRTFNMLLRKHKKKELWALQNVSFTCYPGNIIGVIGSNGAGKTTLCRLISGLIRPDTGRIKIKGSVSALLSLGIGFNPTLSGKENIFLNGMMLGFSQRYVEKLFHEIVEFSELGDFINEPVKNYSSGMRSRLGFSIAATIEPEILVIDETLNPGDISFSEKAGKRLQQIITKSKIVIIVTHNLPFVEQFCTRALWIDGGILKEDSAPDKAIHSYTEFAQPGGGKASPIKISQTKRNAGIHEAVKLENLGLKYSLISKNNPRNNGRSVISKTFWHKKRFLWPLKDINFTVNEGEILGIIGRNGAGKTTLCRVLSGILRPDTGKMHVNGSITALLTLGAGFNLQLTGKDNIYLNGLMLGIPKRQLTDLYPQIVEFSGIKHAIDQPIKHYSSGMRSRLGFSIVAMIKPDIFIIDEILSAGDMSFYEKAVKKIQNMMENAKAVIVVTHNMNFVLNVCTRAICIDKGVIKFSGNPHEVVKKYRQLLNSKL